MDEIFSNRMKWSRSYLREGVRGQDSELKSFKFTAISSYLIIDNCHPFNLFIFSIFPVMYSTVLYCTVLTDVHVRTHCHLRNIFCFVMTLIQDHSTQAQILRFLMNSVEFCGSKNSQFDFNNFSRDMGITFKSRNMPKSFY